MWQGYLAANLAFFGTQEEARPYIDQLLALEPTRFLNVTVPWNELQHVFSYGAWQNVCRRGDRVNSYTVGLNTTDVEMLTTAFRDLVAFSEKKTDFRGQFVIQRYSSDVAMSVPEEKRGVYPWRDINAHVYVKAISSSTSQDDMF
jgi:hypothetical protein